MHTMNDVKLYDFPQHGDERGHLVVVEGGERYVGGGVLHNSMRVIFHLK